LSIFCALQLMFFNNNVDIAIKNYLYSSEPILFHHYYSIIRMKISYEYLYLLF
jgi:hypothetical protein